MQIIQRMNGCARVCVCVCVCVCVRACVYVCAIKLKREWFFDFIGDGNIVKSTSSDTKEITKESQTRRGKKLKQGEKGRRKNIRLEENTPRR